MDGLTLARTCRERSALPAFIMLTSFEEFGYIKQAMGAGVVDYLVKLDLTPENLQTALAKAAEKVKKERALLGELSAQENLAESVRSYQERFFVRLYAGLFPDEAALEQPLQHMELNLASDAYLVASCEIIANTALTPAQQLKLSFPAADAGDTLQNYLPCYVTGASAMRCNVLFCLTDAQCQNYRTVLRPLLERASQILYNYFTVRLLWAVGRPTGSLLGLARCCRENAHLQPCSRWSSHPVRGGQRGRRHRREDAGGGTGAGVYSEPPFRAADAGRCGGCIQIFRPTTSASCLANTATCGLWSTYRDPHRCGEKRCWNRAI